ncbi:zinc finger protein 560-like isoform X2 [Aricia agestis]|uniref:zinc finger protein 560-like isoform X2 n=1 Tax=Aricia agestis TaxID=91739 RepID=UPI001C205B34|nr:zinc finger protein 560-like isoform X2 [Aricia agestis]
MSVPSVKPKGPIIDPALCRCCGSIKKCRLLTVEYDWQGNKEIYSEMFMDVFGLLLSRLDGETKDACICATCVSRLRDASVFRQQVLRAEELFLKSRLESKGDNINIEVKIEPDFHSDMGDHDDYEEIVTKKVKVEKAAPKIVLTRSGKRKEKSKSTGKSRHQIRTIVIERPDPSKPKRLPPHMRITDDEMVHLNTKTIIENSYVCPFRNRISFYYCYYCRDQFTNPAELREHTLTHNPKKMFEMENKKIPKVDVTRVDCRLCDDKIDDVETLKTHLRDTHKKKVYDVKNEFLKFRLTLNNLTCTECGSVFPFFDSLQKHMIDHFGTYTCDVCGSCFLEPTSLRSHIKTHNKVDANFPCEICGKNLKSKYSMGLHVRTVHEKKPTVNCYKCEAAFLSYAQRNRHLIEAHGDQRTFPCEMCDKVYNRRKTLMEHMRRSHLKVYKHQCDLCDQKFYLPSRLKEHMATHTGERNFRCELCDKCYPRLQSLQEHKRTHATERRFECDVCNMAFAQIVSLKTHMKTHNQFEMPSY